MALPTVKLTSAVKGRIFAALIGAGVAGPSAYVATELTVPSESIVLVPHGDPVGLKTICAGHLVKKGEKVKDRYTEQECIDIFVKDWKLHQKMLAGVVKVPYRSPWMQGALEDFTFNKGIGNVASSTLLKKLNNKQYDAACEQLTEWIYAKGVKLPGLVIRASKQYKYCMGDEPSDYKQNMEMWMGE